MKAIACTIIGALILSIPIWVFVQQRPGRWETAKIGGMMVKTDTLTGDSFAFIPAGAAVNKTGKSFWMKLGDDAPPIKSPGSQAQLAPARFVPPPVSSLVPDNPLFSLTPQNQATSKGQAKSGGSR